MGDTRKFFHDCNCIFTYAYRYCTRMLFYFFSITYVQYAYFTPARWRTVAPWLLKIQYAGYWTGRAERDVPSLISRSMHQGRVSSVGDDPGLGTVLEFDSVVLDTVGWVTGRASRLWKSAPIILKVLLYAQTEEKIKGNLENKVTMVFVLLVITQGSNKIHHNQSKHTINLKAKTRQ